MTTDDFDYYFEAYNGYDDYSSVGIVAYNGMNS